MYYFCCLDKEDYPNFARTIPPNTKMGPFVVEICKKFGWNRITLVVSGDQEALFTAAAVQVRSHFFPN